MTGVGADGEVAQVDHAAGRRSARASSLPRCARRAIREAGPWQTSHWMPSSGSMAPAIWATGTLVVWQSRQTFSSYAFFFQAHVAGDARGAVVEEDVVGLRVAVVVEPRVELVLQDAAWRSSGSVLPWHPELTQEATPM